MNISSGRALFDTLSTSNNLVKQQFIFCSSSETKNDVKFFPMQEINIVCKEVKYILHEPWMIIPIMIIILFCFTFTLPIFQCITIIFCTFPAATMPISIRLSPFSSHEKNNCLNSLCTCNVIYLTFSIRVNLVWMERRDIG